MKKITINKGLICGIVLLIALPLVFSACTSSIAATETTTTPSNELTNNVPPLDDGVTSVQIEFTYDQLLNQKNITKEVEVTFPGSLILTLGSNQTTGFQWQENAKIGDTGVLSQYSHQFVEPQSGLIGAAGKEVFVFKTLAKGTSTIQLQYSRPWEGGEKAEWTIDLTLVVK